jgi:hypothetical protein
MTSIVCHVADPARHRRAGRAAPADRGGHADPARGAAEQLRHNPRLFLRHDYTVTEVTGAAGQNE